MDKLWGEMIFRSFRFSLLIFASSPRRRMDGSSCLFDAAVALLRISLFSRQWSQPIWYHINQWEVCLVVTLYRCDLDMSPRCVQRQLSLYDFDQEQGRVDLPAAWHGSALETEWKFLGLPKQGAPYPNSPVTVMTKRLKHWGLIFGRCCLGCARWGDKTLFLIFLVYPQPFVFFDSIITQKKREGLQHPYYVF